MPVSKLSRGDVNDIISETYRKWEAPDVGWGRLYLNDHNMLSYPAKFIDKDPDDSSATLPSFMNYDGSYTYDINCNNPTASEQIKILIQYKILTELLTSCTMCDRISFNESHIHFRTSQINVIDNQLSNCYITFYDGQMYNRGIRKPDSLIHAKGTCFVVSFTDQDIHFFLCQNGFDNRYAKFTNYNDALGAITPILQDMSKHGYFARLRRSVFGNGPKEIWKKVGSEVQLWNALDKICNLLAKSGSYAANVTYRETI